MYQSVRRLRTASLVLAALLCCSLLLFSHQQEASSAEDTLESRRLVDVTTAFDRKVESFVLFCTGEDLTASSVKDFVTQLLKDFWYLNPTLLVWWVAPFTYALVYKRRVVDKKHRFKLRAYQAAAERLGAPDADGEDAGGYRHSVFECCADGDIFLHAAFCFHSRIADTYHTAGVMDFWLAFCLSVCCPVCFMSCIMPCKHGQLRTRLSDSKTSAWGLDDMCLACCCACCVVCHEARHVDQVVQVRVRCCCVLEPIADARVPLVVGEAVCVNQDKLQLQLAPALLDLDLPALPATPNNRQHPLLIASVLSSTDLSGSSPR